MMGSVNNNKNNKDNKKQSAGKGMTCDRTYVSERCSRAAAVAAAAAALAAGTATADPEPHGRHQRRGAVREKQRSKSLNKRLEQPRRTTADNNVYVQVPSYNAATEKVTLGRGGRYGRIAADDPPLIDITAIGEDVMTKPVRPPTYGAAIENREFPAYVPWTALVNGGDGTPEPRCRCAACRRQHGCSGSSASFSSPPSSAETAGAVSHERRRASSCFKKWRICALLCACLPSCLGAGYRPLRRRTQRPKQQQPSCPSDGCRGDVNVPHCECVDWDAVERDDGRVRGGGTSADSGSDHRRRLNNYRRRNELLTPYAAPPPIVRRTVDDGETVV